MTVKVYWYIERQYKKIKQFVRCIYTNEAISDCFAKVFFSVDAADGGTELSCHKRAVNQIEGVIINVRGVLKQMRGLHAKMGPSPDGISSCMRQFPALYEPLTKLFQYS